VLLLDCSAMIDIEFTALKMLTEAEDKLRRGGIVLWVAAMNPEVLARVKRSTLGERLGRERMFFNRRTAVESYLRGVRPAAPP
jgi:MFS superfamily sulfate permease-like transporter